jgi:quinol monooxygenase YgiN
MSDPTRATGADHPVIVFASFRPIQGKEEELQALLSWMVENTRSEPGCERYDLYRHPAPGETFHLFERYQSNEALEEHRAADHYIEYRRQVKDLINGPVDVVLLQEVDAAR